MAFYSDKKLKSVAVNSFVSKENHKAVYVLHLFFLVSLAGWIGESVFFRYNRRARGQRFSDHAFLSRVRVYRMRDLPFNRDAE